MDDIETIMEYINAKVEYEVASALSSHEAGYHDDDEDSCRVERKAMELAEAKMKGLKNDKGCEPAEKFIGWSYTKANGDEITIGKLEDGTKKCMYTTTEGAIKILATFETDEQAQIAIDWLVYLVNSIVTSWGSEC